MTAEEYLFELFAAGGGAIDGRIRLQKIAYLLQKLSGRETLTFIYHHYGPFSRDLAEALNRAVDLDQIDEEFRDTSMGTVYSRFRQAAPTASDRDSLAGIPADQARTVVARLKAHPSLILELAATIDWLRTAEKVTDWKTALRRRKPVKATDANIARAETLLAELGLAA